MDEDAYATFNLSPPWAALVYHETAVIAHSMGLGKQDLLRVDKRITMANKEEITIIAAVLLALESSTAAGEKVCTSASIFVSSSTYHFYLSCTTFTQLSILDSPFPNTGAGIRTPVAAHLQVSTPRLTSCGCLSRTSPPPCPSTGPLVPVPPKQLNGKMRVWLMNKFASSTFNQCPHQPLPIMTGPPMAIRVTPDTHPTITQCPVTVPLHWKEEVSRHLGP